LLQDGSVGVFFNDYTKIVSDYENTQFIYVTRDTSTKEDVVNQYQTSSYPEKVHKKVVLLNHFRKHLLKDVNIS